MKIRTDFVTNSSSSSYVCSKVATFSMTDKSGNSKDITFKKDDLKFYGDDAFSDVNVGVPALFNKFMVSHYKDTKKLANASMLLDSLISGKKTPLVKEFVKSTNMKDISEPVSYFCVENAQISAGTNSHMDESWMCFLDNIKMGYRGIGDYAEFIKAYKDNQRYSFMVFSFGEQDVISVNRFSCGYDEKPEFVFEEIKKHFAEGNEFGRFRDSWEESKDEIIASSSKDYLSVISSRCNLPEDVLSAIDNGDIKVLFFANGTGVCDEIIWYSGELKQDNIRIHLFAEGEDVTDIEDNTSAVNDIIKYALSNVNKTVKPADKKTVIAETEEKEDAAHDPTDEACKVISITKEEAKGVWTTKKDMMGRTHIVSYKGSGESTLYIPSEIGGEDIELLGLTGSYDMIPKKSKDLIKEVIIGDGIKYIGRFAFAEMKNLENVVIPPSVTHISPFAFWGTDKVNISPNENGSYADSLVDYIGEYTGQFPIEGKSICFIDFEGDYRDQESISINDYKLLSNSIGVVFQPKPNSKTSLIVIRDDFCGVSDKLNAALELIKSGKIDAKAITEKNFLAMVNKK